MFHSFCIPLYIASWSSPLFARASLCVRYALASWLRNLALCFSPCNSLQDEHKSEVERLKAEVNMLREERQNARLNDGAGNGVVWWASTTLASLLLSILFPLRMLPTTLRLVCSREAILLTIRVVCEGPCVSSHDLWLYWHAQYIVCACACAFV